MWSRHKGNKGGKIRGNSDNVKNEKWKPAIVQKKTEPRSYILQTDNGRNYWLNKSHILKADIDEDHLIEISDDENDNKTSDEM